MTFVDYIIKKYSRTFLSMSLLDMEKCNYKGTLEDWFRNTYYEYDAIYKKNNMNKEALMIAHNNTHSTSRIFRNVELIRKDIPNTSSEIEHRLVAIETACRECREQVDKLYEIIKTNNI